MSPVAAPQRGEPAAVSLGPEGRLVYVPDAQGNRVPDFSHCGYDGGDRSLPNAPVRVVVAPVGGDSTARIQAAIDYVAGLPSDTNGVRGAVLLLRGRHEIDGGLAIGASGVVLRGQGMDENGTVLVATGRDRRTLIRIVGENNCAAESGGAWQIADDSVPVGAMQFHVAPAHTLKPGDTVRITRPSTQSWIDQLGMTAFGGGFGDWRLVWKPGSRDLSWDRVVQSVEGDLITLDAPITTALEKKFGGGQIQDYRWPGRIRNVGVENLRCESVFDYANPKDENHSWFALTMENAQDAWVRQVTATHFAGSMVAVYETCKQITVQDCVSLAPVSEEGGYRRHTFFTMGQMTLFLRCHAESGRHDFSVGHCAAGPNAFVQCDAAAALGDSGPIESWASGVLYDNVSIDGNGLSLANRGAKPHGAGWSGANSVLWQCNAATIRCENPPGARNWAFGCWGEFEGNGTWRSSNESVRPDSLYVAQVSDRLGPEAAARIQLLPRPPEGSTTNPSLEQAQDLVAAAAKPATQLLDFIERAATRDPIPAEPGSAKRIEEVVSERGRMDQLPGPAASAKSSKPLQILNGWLACDGRLLVGAITNVAWWRGNIRPGEASTFGPGVTRFVPGRIGPGWTDDLDQLADTLAGNGVCALDHNYGLWHDRRRDDHERVRRSNGDTWPPFYELPFARSGQGTAWDGLSRYDLTKYNPWYWSRLREFADICDQRGLVLFHQNYFQHNILEAGAHWADFPWRPANNINHTGFPEPPVYAGNKRIFMAEQFYDVSHPVRRELHRSYIRQCLNNFGNNSNVIQFTSAEFTGPLPFMEFWLDTIAEWESETGKHPLVALSCTKDVQDAILADPKRSGIVGLIDFRYWWQTRKGLFAPPGGKHLAPRQFERQWKGGRPTDTDLAQMAAEYRHRFPEKAVICDFDAAGWAFVCAGGSMAGLPRTTDPELLAAIPHMQPWPAACASGRWVLRGDSQYLVYSGPETEQALDLAPGNRFLGKWVDPRTGECKADAFTVLGGPRVHLPKPPTVPAVLWLKKEARYKIAVCDWMILKRQKLGAFSLTKEIGADGVEVDMGSLGDRDTFDSQLAKPEVREQFLAKAGELNLEICSLAMSGFYAQSFAERPTVPRLVRDCVDTMKAMRVKIAFLPLGVRGDLVKHPELRPAIVARLKTAGRMAEQAGVIIGVETALPAAEEAKLLDEVGSPAIRSYFNFANALQSGRDLLQELRTLGKDRICQIHCTDQDGVLLQDNQRLDLPAVKRVLDEMGWSGWLVIERSRDAKDSRNVKKNFGANTAYLKTVFQNP